MFKLTQTAGVFLLVVSAGIILPTWKDELAKNKHLMKEGVHQLLAHQLKEFSNGSAPKSADPAVKNIPIVECNEELIDIRHSNSARIKMLPDPQTPFASPDCNSGYPAASKIRKTVYTKLLATVDNVDAMAHEFGYKPGQINIVVFEGLRSVSTQKMLFDNKAQEIRHANPAMSDEEVFKETSKWVSPVVNNIPFHTTGGAVDIRLWDNERNQLVDLGPFGAVWGKNTSAPTFSDDATDMQKKNRLYLLIAAANAGLVNYVYEYWHYSSGDRYASYWVDAAGGRKSVYGMVDE